jgi:hypothetical protein
MPRMEDWEINELKQLRAKLEKRDETRNKVLGWVLGLGALWLVGWLASSGIMRENANREAEAAAVKRAEPTIYRIVCDSAWKNENNLDFSTSRKTHVTIELTEDCFSGILHLPSRWTTWSFQHAPDNSRRPSWIAFWVGNQGTTMAMPLDDNGTLKRFCTFGCNDFRLEGRGKILFYALTCLAARV